MSTPCTLASPTADPTGWVQLPVVPGTTTGEVSRRVSRTATLDGGAVLNDFGFSDADRTIELRWLADSQAREATVQRLIELYGTLVVVTRAGAFLAAPETYTPGPRESTLRLLVIAKLSA